MYFFQQRNEWHLCSKSLIFSLPRTLKALMMDALLKVLLKLETILLGNEIM